MTYTDKTLFLLLFHALNFHLFLSFDDENISAPEASMEEEEEEEARAAEREMEEDCHAALASIASLQRHRECSCR